MKPQIKPFLKVLVLFALAIGSTLFGGCKKAALTPSSILHDTVRLVHDSIIYVKDTSNTVTDTAALIPISLIGLRSDSGYCYKIGYHLPVIGDSNDKPNTSTLRLFENGVELSPAHSNHKSIRVYGLGQFSHWGDELYFSTSDNTSPLNNGRKYSYKMK